MSGFRWTMEEARRARYAAQGLDGGGPEDAPALLAAHGPVRTIGGVDAYLALRARAPGLGRDDVDRAVREHRARVLPAARGCIYLVDGREAPRWLRLAELLSAKRAERDAGKAGILPGELDEVGDAVVGTLGKAGPLTADRLRRELPDGVVRSLGDAGKKVGLSSTLPPALRRLEFTGRIERTLPGGRLDTEKYEWAPPPDGEAPDPAGAGDLADLLPGVAESWLRAAGAGTVKEFAAWAGTSQRDARAALGTLPVEEGTVEGVEGPVLRLSGGAEPGDPAGRAALLPFEDNLLALAGGPAFLADERWHETPVPTWGRSKPTTLGRARHMTFRSVAAEGRLVGFWEYDPGAAEIVTALFDPPEEKARREVGRLARETARFVAGELGHGRSFSLDTDESLRKRADDLRERG